MFSLTRAQIIGLMLFCYAGFLLPGPLSAQATSENNTLSMAFRGYTHNPGYASAGGLASQAFLSLCTVPIQAGNSTMTVTCTPEFFVFRLPPSVASGAFLSFGRLVPGQLIVSGQGDPKVFQLNPDQGFSFLKGIIDDFKPASVSGDLGSATSGPAEGETHYLSRIRGAVAESPLLREAASWAMLGLALSSLTWSFLFSHLTNQAGRLIRKSPFCSLFCGFFAVAIFLLIIWAGWQTKTGLFALPFLLIPVFPIVFLAPVVTATFVGYLIFGWVTESRVRSLFNIPLVVSFWFMMFLPVIGEFLFALSFVWGVGGLMLTGVFPAQEFESKSKEVVKC